MNTENSLNATAGLIEKEIKETSPLILTAAAAAAIFHKSARSWHNWNATGKVPRPIRIGRSTFWRREEILAWFTAGCPDRETWEFMNRDQTTSNGTKKSARNSK
jgi:predicted DNA-binding transcriptional regulator AlpA